MKFIISAFVLSIPLLLSPSLHAQADARYCQKAQQLILQIEANHVQARPLDDRLSEEVFDAFFQRTDPEGLFFLQKDIEKLAVYRHRIDEHIISQKCVFLRKATEIYRARLMLVDSMVRQLGRQPFEASDAQASFSQNKRAENIKELELKWKNLLRRRTLAYIYQQVDDLPTEEELTELEGSSRRKAMLRVHCRLERLLDVNGGFDAYVGKLFLKALANRYDPHTAYFSAIGRNAFESGLAKEDYTFGLELEENESNEFQIAELLPGGPAWKSQQLNQGDIVLEIRLSNGEELDLACSEAYEISQKLMATEALQLEIQVKKKSGQLRKVSLEKEKMAVQDNVINSFILEGEKKIGYIYLPGFYTSWEDERALGLSNDVAKELLKLQLEGIEGLVLDLRHNGGGAIIEALGLAGIFIDMGPLAIGKDSEGNLNLLKDLNRGMAYGGPLVVLVDGLSASASEIFAAALQDYQRAVIVGDTTYGKSSGQQFVPFDERRPFSGDDLKVTMQKYYRITGNTYQGQGVVPDVVLPQLLKAWMPREKDYSTALSQDKVDKELNYQRSAALPLEELASKSQERLARDAQFLQLKQASDSLFLAESKEERIPLEWQAYFAYRQKQTQNNTYIMKLEERKASHFQAKNNKFAEGLIEISDVQRLNNEQRIAEIQNDIYIEETYRIILDLINSK